MLHNKDSKVTALPKCKEKSASSTKFMQSAPEVLSVPLKWTPNLEVSKSQLNSFLSDKGPKPLGKRRTHQKSRAGCMTCKRRHLRCDEASPRCSNCIKHRSACYYPQAHYQATHGSRLPNKELGDNSKLDMVQVSRQALEIMKAGSQNLEDYPGAAFTMTPASRELLAFCE